MSTLIVAALLLGCANRSFAAVITFDPSGRPTEVRGLTVSSVTYDFDIAYNQSYTSLYDNGATPFIATTSGDATSIMTQLVADLNLHAASEPLFNITVDHDVFFPFASLGANLLDASEIEGSSVNDTWSGPTGTFLAESFSSAAAGVVAPVAIPEPSTISLMLAAALFACFAAWRRRR